MLNGRVAEFAGIVESDLVGTRSGNGKAHSIPIAGARKIGAGRGISQIAEVVDMRVTRYQLLF